MHLRLFSVILSQLAFCRESNWNFQWEKFQWNNTVVKKECLSLTLKYHTKGSDGLAAAAVLPINTPISRRCFMQCYNCVQKKSQACILFGRVQSVLVVFHDLLLQPLLLSTQLRQLLPGYKHICGQIQSHSCADASTFMWNYRHTVVHLSSGTNTFVDIYNHSCTDKSTFP